MDREQQQLEAGIAALEAQRATLGEAVVDAALEGLKTRLAALRGAAAEPAQSLRQVSILFLDVVGSTALGQRLDPEEIAAVMEGVLAQGTAIVEAHRGKVLQYAGDNLLAAFGAERAYEDDAERAVQCGLALLALGKALGEGVRARHGHAGVDVRVGIHSGGVLLGGGVDEDGSIRGQAVNIAARMEQTAPAGALRISHDTWRLLRGRFEVAVQEPLFVKGVDAPVRSYLVLGERPRDFKAAGWGVEGVETRMVGRDDELRALRDAFEDLMRPGAGLRSVLVVGEAGCTSSAAGSSRASSGARSSRPGRRRRCRAGPTACCTTCSPGACASRTATASRSPSTSSSRACCRCSPTPMAAARRRPMRICSAT
jgi:class 3 adenylate cyclase